MGANISRPQDSPRPTPTRGAARIRDDDSLAFKSISNVVVIPPPNEWLDVLNCSACGYFITEDYLLCDNGGHLTCGDCMREHFNLVCQFRYFSGSFRSKSASGRHTAELVSDPDKEASEGGSKCEGDVASESGRLTPYYYRVENDGSVHEEDNELDYLDLEDIDLSSMIPKKDVEGVSETTEEIDMRIEEALEHMKELELAEMESECLNVPICGGKIMSQSHPVIDNLLEEVELICPYSKDGCEVILPVVKMRAHYKFQCPFNMYNRKLEVVSEGEEQFYPPESPKSTTSYIGLASSPLSHLDNQSPRKNQNVSSPYKRLQSPGGSQAMRPPTPYPGRQSPGGNQVMRPVSPYQGLQSPGGNQPMRPGSPYPGLQSPSQTMPPASSFQDLQSPGGSQTMRPGSPYPGLQSPGRNQSIRRGKPRSPYISLTPPPVRSQNTAPYRAQEAPGGNQNMPAGSPVKMQKSANKNQNVSPSSPRKGKKSPKKSYVSPLVPPSSPVLSRNQNQDISRPGSGSEMFGSYQNLSPRHYAPGIRHAEPGNYVPFKGPLPNFDAQNPESGSQSLTCNPRAPSGYRMSRSASTFPDGNMSMHVIVEKLRAKAKTQSLKDISMADVEQDNSEFSEGRPTTSPLAPETDTKVEGTSEESRGTVSILSNKSDDGPGPSSKQKMPSLSFMPPEMDPDSDEEW